MASVFFYISGHGFGHATRQAAIVNALVTRITADHETRIRADRETRMCAAPAMSIVIRSSAPQWLFQRTVRAPVKLIPAEVDTGIVQIDSVHLDEGQTIERAANFHERLSELAHSEAKLLAEHRAAFVVADAPPLACAAAQSAGIRSVVCSNFTWDWIYAGYRDASASAPHLVPTIQEAYRLAAAGWRLPMHGGFAAIAPVADVPFVARHARVDTRTVRSMLNLPLDLPLVLISFGGYGLRALPLDRLDCVASCGVVVTGAPAEVAALPDGVMGVDEALIYEQGLGYEDLVGAVDVVVTKPGYGIISDCIANGTAILYTSRGHFAEYDVLVREMPRFLRCRFIELEALLAGRWRAALDALLSSAEPPERPRTDGAEVVARLIVQELS